MRDELARTRVLLVWALAFVTLLATACSPETNGTPTPSPPSERADTNDPPSSTSSTNEPTREAPAVEDPLDASSFVTNPCSVLNRTQLATFEVTRPGTPETTGGVAEQVGPFCSWHAAAELGSTIGVGFITGNKNGLSDIYRGHTEFEDFRPTEVKEYPAVFANSPDLRSSGICTMYVGINNALALRATEQGRLDAQGACDRAKQVAAAAVATIRGGS